MLNRSRLRKGYRSILLMAFAPLTNLVKWSQLGSSRFWKHLFVHNVGRNMIWIVQINNLPTVVAILLSNETFLEFHERPILSRIRDREGSLWIVNWFFFDDIQIQKDALTVTILADFQEKQSGSPLQKFQLWALCITISNFRSKCMPHLNLSHYACHGYVQ